MSDSQTEMEQHFGYLVDEFGFSLVSFSDEPRAFDNFVGTYRRGDLAVQITRDRSQVFVSFSVDESHWQDKERILTRAGIKQERFSTVNGLWKGYEITNQAQDLREHLETIVQLLHQ